MCTPFSRPKVDSPQLNRCLDLVQAVVFVAGQLVLVVVMFAAAAIALRDGNAETLIRLGGFGP